MQKVNSTTALASIDHQNKKLCHMLKLQISQFDFKYVRDGIHINQIKSSQPGRSCFWPLK